MLEGAGSDRVLFGTVLEGTTTSGVFFGTVLEGTTSGRVFFGTVLEGVASSFGFSGTVPERVGLGLILFVGLGLVFFGMLVGGVGLSLVLFEMLVEGVGLGLALFGAVLEVASGDEFRLGVPPAYSSGEGERGGSRRRFRSLCFGSSLILLSMYSSRASDDISNSGLRFSDSRGSGSIRRREIRARARRLDSKRDSGGGDR